MKKKNWICLALALMMSLGLLGCTPGASAPSTPPSGSSGAPQGGGQEDDLPKGSIVLKITSVCGAEGQHPFGNTCVAFEKRVEEESNGVIDVQVYPNSQLGNEREFYEGMLSGDVEMFYGGSMVLGNFTNKVKFWGLPFFFSSGRQACLEFFDTYGEQLQKDIYDEIGLYCIWTDNGAFQPASQFEIKTPADMAGLKLRCHEIDTFIKGYEALGAAPVPMAFGEIYTGLQQGTINGTHTNDVLLESNKFYEVCNYYASNINITYDMGVTGISGAWFDQLPEKYQEIVWRNAQLFSQEFNANLVEWEQMIDKRLQEECGVTFTVYTPAQRQAFIDVVQPVYEEFKSSGIEPKFDEYYAAAQELNQKHEQ